MQLKWSFFPVINGRDFREIVKIFIAEEEVFMLTIKTWWEDIFSGKLSVGLNEKKVHQLEDESFLYYSEKCVKLPLYETASNLYKQNYK